MSIATTNSAAYRRNITKSRSGHYHLTVIEKATGHKQTGRHGWNNARQATAEEYAYCVTELERRATLRASTSRDLHAIALAVAAAEQKPNLILSPDQADAVCTAMCALNSVSRYGALQFTNSQGELIGITTKATGEVAVEKGSLVPADRESYATQAEFAIAYRVDGSAALRADAPNGFLDEGAATTGAQHCAAAEVSS